MNAYKQVASEHGTSVAQMLVTVDDMENQRRFLNIKNTVLRLFENNMLPIIAEAIIERPVSSVLQRERRHTRCLVTSVTASPLMVWLSNRLHMAGTIVVSDAVASAIVAGRRGLNRGDVISLQGDFTKGDVLHIYGENGDECARGLISFSSEETMMLARNADQPVEDVLVYKTKSAIISAENMLVLEERHQLRDAPLDDRKLVAAL